MAETRTRALLPPIGGLDRRLDYQTQPPFTTYDARNVRGTDVIEDRGRIGSRACLGKAFQLQLGASGDRVPRLLAVLRNASGGQATLHTEAFTNDGTIGAGDYADWDVPSWAGDGASPVSGGSAKTTSTSVTEEVGGVWGLFSPAVLSTYSQTITASIAPLPGLTNYGSEVWLYLFLDDTTPDEATSIAVRFRNFGNPISAYAMELYVDNVLVDSASVGTVGDNVVRVTWTADKMVQVYWGTLKTSPDINYDATAYSPSGTRAAFILKSAMPDTSVLRASIDYLKYEYQTNVLPLSVVASAAGAIFQETSPGVLTERTGLGASLGNTAKLSSASRLGELFIADADSPVNITKQVDGALAGDTVTLTSATLSAAYADLTALIDDADSTAINYKGNYVIHVMDDGATDTATIGVYGISSVTASNIVLASAASSGGETAITFRIVRAAKVFDPNGTLVRWTATSGTVPPGVTGITRWNDRLLLWGDPEFEHVLYASKQGDPYDFNFGASPVIITRAWASVNSFLGSDTAAGFGSIGEPLKAVIPLNDQRCLLAGETGMFQLIGDPAQGGIADLRSPYYGIIGQFAWAYTNRDSVIFLTRNGLWEISTIGTELPRLVSGSLPDEFVQQLEGVYEISLQYSVRQMGVYVYLTPKTVGEAQQWFIDMQTGALWRDSLAEEHEPFYAVDFPSDDAARANMLVACRDGYIRQYSDALTADDGETVTSYFDFGPFLMGMNRDRLGIMRGFNAVLGQDSDSVTWALRVGNSGEEAAKNETNRASGTLSAGRNHTVRVDGGGHTGFLRLSSTGRLIAEAADALFEDAGPVRP